MVKFDFSIRARSGLRIESVVIMGKDREDAERKLLQMYRYCEVLRCDERTSLASDRRPGAASLEDILTMIAK
jgi:hypothetical protein